MDLPFNCLAVAVQLIVRWWDKTWGSLLGQGMAIIYFIAYYQLALFKASGGKQLFLDSI